jgi:hypothetical protein
MPATPPSTPPSTPPPALFSAGAILTTPPPPSATPLTSPQLAQQAARDEERNLRIMGSPEQRRTPTVPSIPTSTLATYGGRTYHHLPANLAAQLAALPPMPARPLSTLAPSTSASTSAPAPAPALASTSTFGGHQTYSHLPANLDAQLAALPPIPTRPSLAGPPQILTAAQLAAARTSLPSLYPQPIYVSLYYLFMCIY